MGGEGVHDRSEAARPVIATLAVGDTYLRLAAACLASARQAAGDRYEYVVFAGKTTWSPAAGRPWLRIVDVTDMLDARVPPDALAKRPLLARAFKCIPFSHPDYLHRDLLFLDADSLVFEDRFDEVFASIRADSVFIMGQYMPDDYNHVNIEGQAFNLKEEAARVGLTARNMNVNSGFVGRAGDEAGQRFGMELDRLLTQRPLAPFPGRYFNDEPYVMLAFQSAAAASGRGRVGAPASLVCTTYGATLRRVRTGRPDVFKRLSGQGLVQRPAIVHFVGYRNFRFYLQQVRAYVPEGPRLRAAPPRWARRIRGLPRLLRRP